MDNLNMSRELSVYIALYIITKSRWCKNTNQNIHWGGLESGLESHRCSTYITSGNEREQLCYCLIMLAHIFTTQCV